MNSDAMSTLSVSEAIRTKRAVRRFAEQPVPEPVLQAILHAGRRAQSSKNSQPWHFVVIKDRTTLAELAECGGYAGHLAGAAFAVAFVAPAGNEFDLGQAAAYMQLAAWEHGVGSCIASLWEAARARAILRVPESLTLDLAISFGYPAEAAPTTPRAGGRKLLDEVIRWERWQ
jgi:nitroreductase